MKRMTRILALLLTMGTLLCACSGGAATAPADTSPETTTAPPAPTDTGDDTDGTTQPPEPTEGERSRNCMWSTACGSSMKR